MSAIPAVLPARVRRPGLASIGLLATLGVLALAAFGISQLFHSGPQPLSVPVYTAPGKAFRIAMPHGWHPLSGARLRGATAALTRGDGLATIAVRPAPALRGTTAEISRALAARLKQRFPGFKPLNARVARLRGGKAMVYTFLRNPAGTVQTVVIAPAAGRVWEVDAILSGAAPQVARQTGAMLATFGS